MHAVFALLSTRLITSKADLGFSTPYINLVATPALDLPPQPYSTPYINLVATPALDQPPQPSSTIPSHWESLPPGQRPFPYTGSCFAPLSA
jgi:hypothetical protein